MKYCLTILTLILLSGCANIVPLTGGEKDEKVPQLIKSNLTETNFKSSHIRLEFDEYVTAGDGVDAITIQPKHSNFNVSSNDKTIRIEFDSALHPNTTYNLTINNGIKDLNEGNLYSYSYVFSTGDHIDTNYVEYSINTETNNKDVKIGLCTMVTDSLFKLKFDYLYPFSNNNVIIKGLGTTIYNCWIFTDKNKDNIPDEYAPVYYDTIALNSSKSIEMNNWFDSRNDNSLRYKRFTKVFRMTSDLNSYNIHNEIYTDKDSCLFFETNNDTLPDLDLKKELSEKIQERLQGIKSSKDYTLIIDKCGIRNLTITDKLNIKDDGNYFYINSKTRIDSINLKVTFQKDSSVIFFNKINTYEDISKISTLKLIKQEKTEEIIILLYRDDKMILTKKINLKNDQIFYLEPGNYRIEIYKTDLYKNISFDFKNLKRINCKIIKQEIVLKPNWDEVLQLIF